jgi:hypothetical protein
MRKFWKDYAELWKLSGQFYKKHWLGVIVLSVIGFVMGVCWLLSDYIWEGIKCKFKKEDEES